MAQRSLTSHQAVATNNHREGTNVNAQLTRGLEGLQTPQRMREAPLVGFMRSRQPLAATTAAADVSTAHSVGVNEAADDGGVGGEENDAVEQGNDGGGDEEEEEEEEEVIMTRRSRGGTICMTSGCLPAFLSNLLDAPRTRGTEASALGDNDDDGDDDDEESDPTIITVDGDDDDDDESSSEEEEEEEMESGELPAVEEEEEEEEVKEEGKEEEEEEDDDDDDEEEEDDDGDDEAERKSHDKDGGEPDESPLEEVTVVPDWSAARRQTRAEGHQILVVPPEQIKQHGPNYRQLALGGLAVPSSSVQRSASFIAANRRPTSTIRGPLAPAPIVAATAADGDAPPVTIVVDSEPPQVVTSGDDDVSTGVRGEQEGEELVGAYTIATLRQKWAETASEPLLAESGGTSSGGGTPRTDPTTTTQADGDHHGEPSARTEKRKRKEKKKKGRKAYSSRRLYVDVLLVEATELSFPGKALQAIYGAKSLGDPYARLSVVRSLGAAPIGNVDDHCYPYCTRAVKKEIDHPVWLDGVTFAYERLSVGKLWDQIQPRGERQDPAQREEWNAAKAQFVKRWKKLQKGDRTPAQQAFFDMCRAKLEPNLEVEVYFTMGGRRDGLVGSVSVPLCDLQDGLMHDLWLNLRPNANLPAPRNAAEQRSMNLDKWAQHSELGMWGSVHLVIQKSKKPHLGMLSMHGPPVSPLPLRMEVGDIILFDSSRLLMQGTKLATRSPWDHAALVVKKRNKPGLRLFEATMDGVQVFNLTRRLQFYVKDTKIALRRLHVERTEEMMEALYEFIEQVKGRPYKKNPFQLIKALAKFNAHDNQGSIFCSQLVAAAYQMMGLLSMDEPANNYLPVDLASLKLLKGSLGDLMVVPRLQKPKPSKKQHH